MMMSQGALIKFAANFSEDQLNRLSLVGTWFHIIISLTIFLIALFVLFKVRKTGTWLTKTATRMIGSAEILNVTMILVLIYSGRFGLGASISFSILSGIFFFL